jgi:PAS domain S-box-containing protein
VHLANPKFSEAPVLILAPTGNDARNASDVLVKAGIQAEICANLQDLCGRAGERTGGLLISEEVLGQNSLASLAELLQGQPPWSDVPVVLLTSPGELKEKTCAILNFLGADANITLVEKPLRAMTLISVIHSSLRSRRRQFEVRNLLKSYAQAVHDEQRATAKFRALFDQSSVFAGIMTLDGKLVEANRLWLEGCGYRAEDELGKAFWACGWWRGARAVQEKIQQGTIQAARGTPYAEVLSYRWADDSEHLVEFGLHPIRDDAGHVIFLHPTGVDITERHHAQARTEFLSQLSQKLSTISDPAEINRTATTEIGQFIGADRCCFLQGLPQTGEVKMLADWHRTTSASVAGTYKMTAFGQADWWKKVQLGTVSINDTRTHSWTKDFLATYKAMQIGALVLVPFIHEGRWVACLCVGSEKPRVWVASELTLLENALARVWPLIERANAERSLREANSLLADKATHLESLVQQRTARLQETITDLESFSYSIAHDMRAPLRALQSFSEILLEDYGDKLPGEPQFLLQRIATAANRMDSLIRDVLNYSRIMRSEFPLKTVNVEQLLRDIVDTYPAFAPEKAHIAIQGYFPPVIGNEAMLTQIFSNLLGNAVKFVPPGRKAEIRLWAEPNEQRVRMFVADKGIGIAADQHEKIFGIFQQANTEYEGTGIGLAIAKKAVERMGGAIGVFSELGQGSTFWVDAELAASHAVGRQDNDV